MKLDSTLRLRSLCVTHAPLCLLLCLCLCVPAVSQIAATHQQPSAPPQQQANQETIRLAGLARSVTVRRDQRGVPYIEADTEDDLYFAQGYVTATDRLWQMDLLRRTARGELAEIFGRPALEEDKRRRLYGFARVTEETAARLPPPARRTLDAYARGVNSRIAEVTAGDAKLLPREFAILGYRPRPWTPADTLAVGKNFAEVLTRSWQADVQRATLADLPAEKRRELLRDDSLLDVILVGTDAPAARPANRKKRVAASPGQDAMDMRGKIAEAEETLRRLAEIESLRRRSFERVGLYLEDFAASNNWVVSGKHTLSGKPLLANDPHLPASAPSIWYMTHLALAGTNSMRVAGVTAPGIPGIIIGHNEQIAWGVTNFGPDVQDVFVETFDPQDPLRYRTPTGWERATMRREEIKVRKGFTDASTETVPYEVTATRHGPIVFERDGKRYALRWTALEAGDEAELDAFGLLNRARDWNSFRRALSRYTGPTQNFIYADRLGNIGYYVAGRIPIRRDRGGTLPYDGTRTDGDLTGFIPFAELPHVFNPPSGIIVTANSRTVGRSYPHFLGDDWAPPSRARRIHELLSATQKHTAESFRRILGDVHSIGGALFAREAVKILESAQPAAAQPSASGDNAKLMETIALLKAWDGRVLSDSRAAPLVAEMRLAFRRRMLAGVLGEGRARQYRSGVSENFTDRVLTSQSPEFLPRGVAGYTELLHLSLADARGVLKERLGADENQWTWGRYSVIRFPHPLASVPFVGSQFTVAGFAGAGSGGALATPNVGASVSLRFIADTADWDASQMGIGLGQSGDPTSTHWSDQLADWRAVTPGSFPFTPAAIARAKTTTLVLEPR